MIKENYPVIRINSSKEEDLLKGRLLLISPLNQGFPRKIVEKLALSVDCKNGLENNSKPLFAYFFQMWDPVLYYLFSSINKSKQLYILHIYAKNWAVLLLIWI